MFGAAAPIGKVAQLRDLRFEATTYVIQALKDQVSSDAAEHQVRKLPMAERAARLTEQQRRLSGVSITGELQPSYGLIDKVNHIMESGQLVWISPSMCGKRDLEVAQGIDHKAQVVQVEKEALKVSASQVETKADVTTPLMLHFALQRRGIAFDQCGLIDWNTHQDYLHRLLFAMSALVYGGPCQRREADAHRGLEVHDPDQHLLGGIYLSPIPDSVKEIALQLVAREGPTKPT